MWYYRRLPDGLVVMHTRPEHAEQLEALQRICFPTLDDAERFKAAHYRRHLELFPDGQFVVLDGDDVGVDPAYRGRGLATALYAARQETVWRLGLKGQVTAGMIAGYGAVRDRMPAEDYYQGVVDGRVEDRTLSMQLGVGFEPRALLAGYLNDPASDGYGVLITLGAEKD